MWNGGRFKVFDMKRMVVQCALIAMLIGLVACQRQDSTTIHQQISSNDEHLVVIQAKTIPVTLPQSEICEQNGCMRYDLQTIQTNVTWINDYFLNRLKKIEPIAFEKYEGPQLDRESLAMLGLSQSRSHVQYLSQNSILATFILHSYQYNAGAEHGLYHDEYVNFDIAEKKRIGIKDLLIVGKERAFVDALYQKHASWLAARQIYPESLALSDNFYYNQKGLVLVYPVYELGSYADGMVELMLPYSQLSTWVKPEYLPTLPRYANE